MKNISINNGIIKVNRYRVTWTAGGYPMSQDFSDADSANEFVEELRGVHEVELAPGVDPEAKIYFRYGPEDKHDPGFVVMRPFNYMKEEEISFFHNVWFKKSFAVEKTNYGEYGLLLEYHTTNSENRLLLRGAKLTSKSVPGAVLSWETLSSSKDKKQSFYTDENSNNAPVEFDGVGCWAIMPDGQFILMEPDFDVFPAGTKDFSVELEMFVQSPLYGKTKSPNVDVTAKPLDYSAEDEWMEGMAVASMEEAREISARGHKTYLIQQLSTACNAAIVGGVDVGGSHYALQEEDQINIGNLAMAAAQGETTLYHADGELCRPYPPWEMGQLAAAAVGHKVYHTTYYNHLKAWVNRATDEELDAIHYGAELPADLKAHMEGLIGQ